jgi:hypothetical protein
VWVLNKPGNINDVQAFDSILIAPFNRCPPIA